MRHNEETMQIVLTGMRRVQHIGWVLFAGMGLLLLSCNKTDSRQALDRIHELETQAKENRVKWLAGKTGLDHDLLSRLGEAYEAFVEDFPDSPDRPEMLYRAGELYAGELGDTDKAIHLFRLNHNEYPEHRTAPSALFYLGYLFQDIQGDTNAAINTYSAFLDRYPSHSMARQVKFELDRLEPAPTPVLKAGISGNSDMNTDTIPLTP